MVISMNNLLKLSFIIRKLNVLSRNTVVPIRFLRISCYCKTNYVKEYDAQIQISNHRPEASEKKNSSLVDEIQRSSTQSDVFQIIKNHGENMSIVEAFKALEALFLLDKMKNNPNNQIPTTKEFAWLCMILKKQVKDLSIEKVIRSLEMLNYFHVPTSTAVIQCMLEIIRNSANNLSSVQILDVNSILSQCQKTPLVEALLIALPIILQSHTTSELYNSDNIDILVNILQSNMIKTNKNKISHIFSVLNQLDESSIKLDHAKIIIKIMAKLNEDDISTNLLKKCQKILADSINSLNPYEVHMVVDSIAQGLHNSEAFYNEHLLDTCAAITISKNFGFKIAVYILSSFNNICYSHSSLLDYIAAKCFEDQDTCNKIDTNIARILICGISIADYKPVFWGALEGILLNNKLLQLPPYKLLNVGLHLAVVDCYWPKLLTKIFENAHQYRKNRRAMYQFLAFYHAVRLFSPNYDGYWPPNDLISSYQPKSTLAKQHFPIKSALENAMGGSQYVLSSIQTQQGYLIDHVVVMRKGGFPIAVNNPGEPTPTTVDDLKSPENSQIILISYIPKFGYARNTQRFAGFWSLMIRTLKSQPNYTLIPVKQCTWMNLTESEQMRYISQAIRLRCDEISTVFNT